MFFWFFLFCFKPWVVYIFLFLLGLQAHIKTIYVRFCKYPNGFLRYISDMNVDANFYGMA